MTKVTSSMITKCGKCGTTITSHGRTTKLCRSCYQHVPTFCATCGDALPKYSPAVHCRKCWQARGPAPQRPCDTCGKPLSRYSNAAVTTCKPCRIPPAPKCEDCGKEMKRGTKSTHCWECYTERRTKVSEKKQCTIPGCESPHAAKGLCALHYQRFRVTRTRTGRHIDTAGRVWVAQQPCQVCGYSRMRSEVHRFIAQGDYVIGNMVALCSRCHREVTAGLTTSPQPLQPATKQVTHHSPT